jgi:hypothetical protein
MMVNTLSWKGRIDKIVPRLSQTCYIIRAVKPFLKQDVLKLIYYAFLLFGSDLCTVFLGETPHIA